MDRETIRQQLIQATESLTPSQVELVEGTERSFTLRVVSDSFAGKSMLKRFETLSGLIEGQAPEIATGYVFDFEAWTKAEFAEVESGGLNGSSGTPARDKSEIAARDLDL